MSVLHLKRFTDDTGETPQEMHRRMSLGHRRCPCGRPAAIRIKTFMPVAELQQRAPSVLAGLIVACMRDGEDLPTVLMRDSPVSSYKPHLCVADIVACDFCKTTAERAAAHGPSFAIVEIDRGPDPTNRVVVGRS